MSSLRGSNLNMDQSDAQEKIIRDLVNFLKDIEQFLNGLEQSNSIPAHLSDNEHSIRTRIHHYVRTQNTRSKVQADDDNMYSNDNEYHEESVAEEEEEDLYSKPRQRTDDELARSNVADNEEFEHYEDVASAATEQSASKLELKKDFSGWLYKESVGNRLTMLFNKKIRYYGIIYQGQLYLFPDNKDSKKKFSYIINNYELREEGNSIIMVPKSPTLKLTKEKLDLQNSENVNMWRMQLEDARRYGKTEEDAYDSLEKDKDSDPGEFQSSYNAAPEEDYDDVDLPPVHHVVSSSLRPANSSLSMTSLPNPPTIPGLVTGHSVIPSHSMASLPPSNHPPRRPTHLNIIGGGPSSLTNPMTASMNTSMTAGMMHEMNTSSSEVMQEQHYLAPRSNPTTPVKKNTGADYDGFRLPTPPGPAARSTPSAPTSPYSPSTPSLPSRTTPTARTSSEKSYSPTGPFGMSSSYHTPTLSPTLSPSPYKPSYGMNQYNAASSGESFNPVFPANKPLPASPRTSLDPPIYPNPPSNRSSYNQWNDEDTAVGQPNVPAVPVRRQLFQEQEEQVYDAPPNEEYIIEDSHSRPPIPASKPSIPPPSLNRHTVLTGNKPKKQNKYLSTPNKERDIFKEGRKASRVEQATSVSETGDLHSELINKIRNRENSLSKSPPVELTKKWIDTSQHGQRSELEEKLARRKEQSENVSFLHGHQVEPVYSKVNKPRKKSELNNNACQPALPPKSPTKTTAKPAPPPVIHPAAVAEPFYAIPSPTSHESPPFYPDVPQKFASSKPATRERTTSSKQPVEKSPAKPEKSAKPTTPEKPSVKPVLIAVKPGKPSAAAFVRGCSESAARLSTLTRKTRNNFAARIAESALVGGGHSNERER